MTVFYGLEDVLQFCQSADFADRMRLEDVAKWGAEETV